MLAALLALSLSLVASGAEVQKPEGARARLFEPQPLDDEFFTESFTVEADLEGGAYVQAQLGISNAGPGDGRGACRLVVVEKGDKPWSVAEVVDRPEWRWDGAKEPTLSVGKCRLAASAEKVSLVASIEGGTLELSLEADAAKLRGDAMRAKNGDVFYDLEIVVPWAKLTGKLARPGKTVRDVTGFGYVDHSRATALPKKTAKRWVRFFGLGAAPSRLVLVREPATGSVDRDGWSWSEGGAKVSITRLQITSTGKKSDAAWKVMLDGDGGPWKITTKELLYRDAPLEEHGWLGAVVGAIVGNPVTYTYRAVLEGKQDHRQITGLFDIAISDE